VRGVFITGTGTGIGKTAVGCALVRALVARGHEVVALKPIETGVADAPEDALALAEACGRPELARHPAWYRAALPASPYAAVLEGAPPVDLAAISDAVRREVGARIAVVEGAGGLLVPLSARETIADLAVSLALPLLLVAPDRLGVLSDTLAVAEAAARRSLPIAAVTLVTCDPHGTDPSSRTNAAILSERLAIPVTRIGYAPRPEALVGLVSAAGLPELLGF
jgi:dethiobiotin synthetase